LQSNLEAWSSHGAYTKQHTQIESGVTAGKVVIYLIIKPCYPIKHLTSMALGQKTISPLKADLTVNLKRKTFCLKKKTFNSLNPGSRYSGMLSIQLQALRVQRVKMKSSKQRPWTWGQQARRLTTAIIMENISAYIINQCRRRRCSRKAEYPAELHPLSFECKWQCVGWRFDCKAFDEEHRSREMQEVSSERR